MDDLGIQARLEQELAWGHGPLRQHRHRRLVQDAWLSGDIAIVHKPGGGVWIFQSR